MSEEKRLDKPAQVSGTIFRPGVEWSTVIGAAQRQYEYRQDKTVPRSFPDRYTIYEISALLHHFIDQSDRRFVDYRDYLALQRELEALKTA